MEEHELYVVLHGYVAWQGNFEMLTLLKGVRRRSFVDIENEWCRVEGLSIIQSLRGTWK